MLQLYALYVCTFAWLSDRRMLLMGDEIICAVLGLVNGINPMGYRGPTSCGGNTYHLKSCMRMALDLLSCVPLTLHCLALNEGVGDE